MSYTPVPAGGIEPPHNGVTTRRLPIWLSRQWLPLLVSNQAARVQSPVPYLLGEGALVPRAGFEPALSDLKDRCPRPLDERGHDGAGSENRTRVFCLEGSGSAIELRPPRAQGWRVVPPPA